jgi:hypothetical protein
MKLDSLVLTVLPLVCAVLTYALPVCAFVLARRKTDLAVQQDTQGKSGTCSRCEKPIDNIQLWHG